MPPACVRYVLQTDVLQNAFPQVTAYSHLGSAGLTGMPHWTFIVMP